MSTWAIARVELTRMLRDRSNLFFVFIFPLLLVVLIGAQFGGAQSMVLGVVYDADDATASDFAATLDDVGQLETRAYDAEDALRTDVARGAVSGGVVLEEGFGGAIEAAEPTTVGFVGRPDATGTSLQQLVAATVAELAMPGNAAQMVVNELDGEGSVAEIREVAFSMEGQTGSLEVVAEELGVDELAEQFEGLGQFDLGASSQLFLFTFLTSLTGGVALIQSRQLGVARRMLSTPTSIGTIVAGQAGGRYLIALMQALYIVVATVLLFQVNWGSPVATTVLIGLFCLVSAAAGLLLGASLKNDAQAAGVGVGVGLGLAALGGSMAPIEVFPEVMQNIARITPHAWANEGMAELVRRDGGLLDILPQLGALSGFAIVLLVLGASQLQRSLTR